MVFVSLVGNQPSAIAVVLLTWVKTRKPPDRILLLPSRQTKPIAERLDRWARERLRLSCDITEVATPASSAGAGPAPPDVLRDYIGGVAARDIVYNADPGPKAMVVAMARALPPGAVLAHADDTHLHVCETATVGGERWADAPLQHLHLKKLLELYDLETAPGESGTLPRALAAALEAIPDAGRLRYGVRLADGTPAVDVLYESYGRLYALFVLGDERKKALDFIRELERLPLALKGLQPRIAVWTLGRTPSGRERTPAPIRHARAAGFLALFTDTPRAVLREWLAGAASGPGHVVPDEERHREAAIPAYASGTPPRSGCTLAVCLGADPSSTLVSLETHRPRRAIIFYDAHTPVVVERARRLHACLPQLPVGEAVFVPTDLHGRGIVAWAAANADATAAARIDITPGSKGQACALARIPDGDLWALQGHRGVAAPVSGAARARLATPSLDVLAAVTGGVLETTGEDARTPAGSQKAFLSLLTEFLACFAARERGEPSWIGYLAERRKCPHGGMQVTSRGGGVRLRVEHRGRRESGVIPGDGSGGGWFELLAAQALLAAGADEVRLNLRWSWPPDYVAYLERIRPPDDRARPHRRELDVAARFGHQVVALSCKTGRVGMPPGTLRITEPLRLARREIEAVARGSFGRMAAPVLAHPKPEPDVVEEGDADRRRAIVVALADLGDPEQLRAKLEAAFRARSTLGDG